MQLSPKRASASRLIGFNLSRWKVDGDTVEDPIVGDWSSSPAGLSFSTPTLTSDQSQILVSGGTAGTEYEISYDFVMQPSGETDTLKATMKVIAD